MHVDDKRCEVPACHVLTPSGAWRDAASTNLAVEVWLPWCSVLSCAKVTQGDWLSCVNFLIDRDVVRTVVFQHGHTPMFTPILIGQPLEQQLSDVWRVPSYTFVKHAALAPLRTLFLEIGPGVQRDCIPPKWSFGGMVEVIRALSTHRARTRLSPRTFAEEEDSSGKRTADTSIQPPPCVTRLNDRVTPRQVGVVANSRWVGD